LRVFSEGLVLHMEGGCVLREKGEKVGKGMIFPTVFSFF